MRPDGAAENLHLVHKPVGMTPLEAMTAYIRDWELTEKTSYAGRLDPMADGLLLVLSGALCGQQSVWQNHEKMYCWELVLGLSSDTYDVLGLSTGTPEQWGRERLEEAVANASDLLSKGCGKRMQPYPAYSSVRVRGHPLFWWAQQGRLDEVEIPQIQVEVYSCEVGCVRWIGAQELLLDMKRRIHLVSGNGFRQEAILAKWELVLQPLIDQNQNRFQFPILSIRSRVSSGTYIRSMAHSIGSKLNVGGLAWSISRAAVGPSLSAVWGWSVHPISRLLFDRVMRIVKKKCGRNEEHQGFDFERN